MNQATTLFVSTLTTVLAIINPLESLPVFLKLLEGQDRHVHRRVAWKACIYATLLLFFFLIFGTLLLKIFEVPLSMVRIVGGIILMRIGFSLFMPSNGNSDHHRERSGRSWRESSLCASGDAADVWPGRDRERAQHGVTRAGSQISGPRRTRDCAVSCRDLPGTVHHPIREYVDACGEDPGARSDARP
jgi:hypothetical protein